MMREELTRTRLLAHCAAYPLLQIEDLFKYLFQSAFGCEHAVTAEDRAIAYIKKESEARIPTDAPTVEELDGAYSRVHLSYLDLGLSPQTLGKLFCRSAKAEPRGETALTQKLQIAREMIAEGRLPFAIEEFDRLLSAWQREGYPAIHHSDAFRLAYHPAYRVIANEYIPYLLFLTRIDSALKKGSVTVAIDGGSASGKSTLAALLSEIYDCTVFHMDDFFLRPEQRTEARLLEIGGNVDRERLLKEILDPLSKGEHVTYHCFDCTTQTLGSPITVIPKSLTVIEGVYSMHPELRAHYDLSAFLDIDPKTQRARIEQRETPLMASRFFKEWIPLENRYFDKMQIKDSCDTVLTIQNDAIE